MHRPVVLFPLPDSPTRPNMSPSSTREADIVDRAHDSGRRSEESASAREVFDEMTDLEQRHQLWPIPGTALSRRRV